MLSGQSKMPDPGGIASGRCPLCTIGIKKVFGGAVALSHGNLSVRAGEIDALLGENGAGRSISSKCLAGTPPPDAGEILIAGNALPPGHSARHAAERLRIHPSRNESDETLSVEENIALANGYQRRGGVIDWGQVRRFAGAALDKMGVDLDPGRLVADLPGNAYGACHRRCVSALCADTSARRADREPGASDVRAPVASFDVSALTAMPSFSSVIASTGS